MTSWFDRILLALALAVGLLVLLGPMGLVWYHNHESGTLVHLTEATVGVAVILRAGLRRLVQAGARSVMQTSVSTFTRTTARAITRRVVRVAVKSFAVVVRTILVQRRRQTAAPGEDVPGEDVPGGPQHPLFAVLLGFAGLFFSLWGILLLVGPSAREDLAGAEVSPALAASLVGNAAAGEVPGAALASASYLGLREPVLSAPRAALLGAVPLLVYAGLIALAGRAWRVPLEYHTAADGLILQAYFTGATSFLPLTTDVEYRGAPRANALVALTSLGGMFLLHLLLYQVGRATGSYGLQFAAAMFLLYAFVYSFPIRPLDGQYLWAQSRLLWLAVWAPVLACFVINLPESFNAIL
jgi:hypothetical protein